MKLSRGLASDETRRPPMEAAGDATESRNVAGTAQWVARQWTQLTLGQHLRALRTYRWPVIALTLLGGVGAGAFSLAQTPVYRADIQLLVSPNFPKLDITDLNDGSNYALQRVRSYAEIANSPEVATIVVDKLDLPYEPQQLMQKVSVAATAGTAVLTVEVVDPTPERARDIANAIGAELPGFISRLEEPTGLAPTPTSAGPTPSVGSRRTPSPSATPTPTGTRRTSAAGVTPSPSRAKPTPSRTGTVAGNADGIPSGPQRSPVKVEVVRQASLPSAPDSPNTPLNVGIGLLGGLGVGFVAAAGLSARDRSVRDEEHAAAIADLPLVGVVPDDRGSAPTAGLDEPGLAETFRQIRTNIHLRSAGQRLTSIMVTSAVQGEAKTTIAGNLALALAKAGENVVLVDCDLRNPSVHGFYQVPNAVGLTDVLRNESTFDNAARKWRPDLPLFVLPAGPVGGQPGERLIEMDKLAQFMESMRQKGMLLVIDGPPILLDAEAVLLASITDATMITARLRSSRADRLATAASVLRATRANLLGVVAVRSAEKSFRSRNY
ncbi:polysaccharide biosynthesis tyrosine autokinase [Micromonospora zamorensis]|uniref:polysaccharide biosynthesis tyrosine autokinase n=1 Tax=Micromonospora zamorensis TaxID=709883 RepID=UPI003CE82260